MALFEIKHRFSGAVLFSLECGSLKIAVEAAVKAGVDLARADLARANLAGADLAGAYLARADLAGANLARADLADAYLARANLAGADLARADLARANLARADLADAYLARADLADANLARANLAGADLAGANLARAAELIAAGQPNGFWAFGYRAEDGALRVKIGCRDKAMPDARVYWLSAEHPRLGERREVLAALDYIEAVARLRGWMDGAAKTEAA